MALLTLALVYRAARDWFDEEAALLAVAVLAWNPVFVTYAKQPMSDVPATAWLTLAIVLAMQRGAASAFGAGLAAGAAVITRPALLIAAATIPFVSLRGEARYRRFVLSGLGAAIGVAIQMAIQAKLFGSPFVTGYGSAEGAFSLAHVPINLGIFAKQIWLAFGPIWLIGTVAGLVISPPDLRWRLLTVFAAVTLPYLFWLPFDHWETLRFLLPGVAILSALIAASFVTLARRMRVRRDGGHRAGVPRRHALRPQRMAAARLQPVGDPVARGALSARRRMGQRQHAARQRRDGEPAQRLIALVRQAPDDQVGLH